MNGLSLPPRATIASLIFLAGLVVSVFALPLIGIQTLKAPPHTSPSVQLFCADGTLVNVTDPNPLVTGFPTGNNGTALYGCGFSTGATAGLLPALAVVRAGNVNASFSLPTGVSIFLVHNPGVLGPLSQSQCATGILVSSNLIVSIPVGSYNYCESFADPAVLVPVTVSWYQA